MSANIYVDYFNPLFKHIGLLMSFHMKETPKLLF